MSAVTRPGDDYYDVYLGFWTNWKYGQARGATLTTTRQSGSLLIAFLAIFVGAAGGSFWRISCFGLHRYFSVPESRDALHHQRQLILRNSETPKQAIGQFLGVVAAWRSQRQHALKRFSLALIFAVLAMTCFAVAGLFSSRVTNDDDANEVLLTGRNCRRIPSYYTGDFGPLEKWQNLRVAAYLNYAQQCYTNAENSEDCRQYVKPKIPLTVMKNATCPFGKGLCKVDSIMIDTGLLDSSDDLGINMPSNLRFQVRIVNQCSPLVSSGYTSLHNQSDYPDIPLLRFHYGNFTGLRGETDYLYQTAANLSFTAFEGHEFILGRRPDYELGFTTVNGGGGYHFATQDTKLIPELQRPDADVTLFFLSAQGISYFEPVDDPWFSAHRDGKLQVDTRTNDTFHLYQQDEAASVMGCITQGQICNPNAPSDRRCQPVRSWWQNVALFPKLWPDPDVRTNQTVKWLNEMFHQSYNTMTEIGRTGGTSALSARFVQGPHISGSLPNDQWQEEVQRWAGASATSLQATFVEAVMGLPGLSENVSVPANTEGAWSVCHSQKIVSSRYSSFSVLGIALIITIGGLLILIDIILEPILDFFHPLIRRDKFDYARLEWKANNTLQLHRLAHEEIGSGTWTGAADNIPVTLPGEHLATLNIDDKRHPCLKPTYRSPMLSGMTTPCMVKSKSGFTLNSPTTANSMNEQPSITTKSAV